MPTAHLEPQSKRRAAAAAAMHGAAAALADEDAVDDVMEEMGPGGAGGEVGPTTGEGEMNHPPLPPGFKVSAPEPQVGPASCASMPWFQNLEALYAEATLLADISVP